VNAPTEHYQAKIYTTDNTCKQIGNITFDIKGNTELREQTVNVTMIY